MTQKMADRSRPDFYIVFTIILSDLNFCVWKVMVLLLTDYLQVVSLSAYVVFETNTTSHNNVIKTSIIFKHAKAHCEKEIKVKQLAGRPSLASSPILCEFPCDSTVYLITFGILVIGESHIPMI